MDPLRKFAEACASLDSLRSDLIGLPDLLVKMRNEYIGDKRLPERDAHTEVVYRLRSAAKAAARAADFLEGCPVRARKEG